MSTGEAVIVMATYNGGRFLGEQLASIRRQSYPHWRLVVRDDGSSDDTVRILRDARAEDDRIELWAGPEGNLGARGCFAALLEQMREAEYVFCADQDDVWQHDKVEVSLAEVKRLEGTEPSPAPIMLFTDYTVIDGSGSQIRASSSVAGRAREVSSLGVKSLLGFNYVWGCTTAVNGPMLRKILPISLAAENHDYWMALVAAAHGGLAYLDTPTLGYRKHSANVTGGADLATPRRRLDRYLGSGVADTRKALQAHDAQMRALFERCVDDKEIDGDTFETITRYVRALDAPRFRRISQTVAMGVRRQGFLQDLAHAVSVARFGASSRSGAFSDR